MDYPTNSESRDAELWQLAQRRVSFKRHLSAYLIINSFLWILWALGGSRQTTEGFSIPWPLWSTLGWGIGLASHFVSAYMITKENSVEKEYNKLLHQKNQK